MNVAVWTIEREQALRELWPSHSATKIARQIFTADEQRRFGDGGRNAVIGKARRLMLPSKAPTPWKPSDAARHPKP